MKILLAICVIIYAVGVYAEETSSTSEKQKEIEDAVSECINKNNVKKEDVSEYIKNTHEIPNTPEMKGYLICIMKKMGMMNDDGTMAKKFLDSKAGEVCKDLSGDENERAYKVGNCLLKDDLFKKMPEFF